MRDIALLVMMLGAIGVTIRVPWIGVLVLSVLSYLNPHRYAWGFMFSFPVYQLLFLVAVVALIKQWQDRQPFPRDWRIVAFFMLWSYFLVTTIDSAVPWAAWPRLIEVSKVYLPFVLTLWLIDTRQKLFFLIITIASSIALVAVKGGIFAIATAFSYRVWGPPGSMFYGNNEFAIATLMVTPLLVLWFRETKDRRIRYLLMAVIPLCIASALSSYSRGALLTIAVLGSMLLWHSKRKWLAIPIFVVGGIVAAQNLPDAWFDRMNTIETYEVDKSAQGRLEAWRDGITYALSNPLTGAGFDGWRHVTRRDWHSAYVEALAEHGFVGFGLWASLLLGSMLSLTRLPRLTRHIPEMKWVANYSYMLRASLAAYATGSLFLGITYWDLLYHIVFIAVLVRKFALEELAEHVAKPAQSHSSPAPLPISAPALRH